jgi:hypothetical protein
VGEQAPGPKRDAESDLARARITAQDFVRSEAGFAQLTTLDRAGFPVARSMTAFLEDDWSVSLIQRRVHARIAQMQRNDHALVTWVGTPAPGATNERPHVFDIGRLPPRAVYLRGRAVFMGARWTELRYREQIESQRALGHTGAPVRTPAKVRRELVGVRLIPVRIRLEGFGEGAQAFEWTVLSESDIPGEVP